MPLRSCFFVTGLLLLCPQLHAADAPRRVGAILIAGNESIRDGVILRRLPLYPGQVLSVADLRRARENLSKLSWFFVTNSGDGSTITVLEGDPTIEFKDILVQVKEKPAAKFFYQATMFAKAMCVESLPVACRVVPGVKDVASELTEWAIEQTLAILQTGEFDLLTKLGSRN
jgi:hypothetical protein